MRSILAVFLMGTVAFADEPASQSRVHTSGLVTPVSLERISPIGPLPRFGTKMKLIETYETKSWNDQKEPAPAVAASFSTVLEPKKVGKFSPSGFALTEQRKKDFSVWFNRQDGRSIREVKLSDKPVAGPHQLANGLVLVAHGSSPATVRLFDTNGIEKASIDIPLAEKEKLVHAEVKPDGTVVIGSMERTFHSGAAYAGVALFTSKAKTYTLELPVSSKPSDSFPLAKSEDE